MQDINPLDRLAAMLGERVREDSSHEEYLTLPVESIFEQEPVDLKTFLYDKKFMNYVKLSPQQELFVEIGSQIYFEQTVKELKWNFYGYKNELVGMWGKGSGKDTVARLILLRIANLLLCLKDPQRYLNCAPGDAINMINVAYSSQQANDVFFEPLKRIAGLSLYFKNIMDPTEGKIKFPKGITLHSGHSEQESQEGHNLIAAVLDEIAAFKAKGELERKQRKSIRPLQHSAEALHQVLTSSAVSRFPLNYKIILISYPRYKGDFIMQKYEEDKDDPRAYVSKGATWDINPTKKKSDFNEEYRKNPEQSRSIYECNPPFSIDAYFKRLSDETEGPVLEAVTFPKRLSEFLPNDDENHYKVVFKPWFRGKAGIHYYAHVDLALSNDNVGVAVVHRSDWEQMKILVEGEEQVLKLPIITVDLWVGIEAPPDGEVDLSSIRQFLFDMHDKRNFYLQKVTYDGFQSADSIQQFQKKGIESERLSVDRDTTVYDTMKDVMYGRRLKAYYRERGVKELKQLTIISGNKIDHPMSGSKDESDGLAGAIYNCVVSEIFDCVEEDFTVGENYQDTFNQFDGSLREDIKKAYDSTVWNNKI